MHLVIFTILTKFEFQSKINNIMTKRLLLLLTFLQVVLGGGKLWADDVTLVDFDFTNSTKFQTSQEFSNTGETKMTVDGKDIYFYHNNTGKSTFSLSSSGLQFGDNNLSSNNYFVAIPLTGIKGEITVTFYHSYTSSSAGFKYDVKDGAISYSASDIATGNRVQGTQPEITKTITVTNGNAVFYFGRNGSSYTHIRGIKITTPNTAPKPKLSMFDFNNNDILYYLNSTGNSSAGRTAATSVSTTFEKNTDYGTNGYLRVKVNIEPDLSTLENPSFSITSSKTDVLSTEGVTAFYKASENRMYIDGVKVVGTGEATLTVTFNGSDNYAGTASTTSSTITVNAATAPTLSLTTPTSTTNAEIGNIIELTANKAFSLVDGQYTTVDGINYIQGTVNGNSVNFAVDLTKQTLTLTMGTTFAPNTLYEIEIPAGKIKSSGVSNAAQTLSFTTAAPETLTPVSDKFWDFEEADGFPASQIGEIAVIDNMELVANSSKKMSFDNTAKSYTDGDKTYNFPRQLKFGGTYATDGSYRIVHFKVAAGSTVNVFGATGSSGNERSAAIRVATIKDKFPVGIEKEILTSSTSEIVKGSFTINATNYPNGAEVWVYSKNSGFNISGIEVTSSKPKLTLSNAGQATSYVYSGSGEDSQNYEITYSYSGEANLTSDDQSKFTVTSSDEAVIKASDASIALDLTNKKFTITGLKVKSAGTATLTFKFAGNDTYAESSLVVPFTVTGKLPFSIKLEDLNIQQRQRRTIMPVITNSNGNPIGFDASGNVIELADDDDPVDYDTYFDFTYSLGSNDIGVTIDGNVVRAGSQSGGPVPVTVTATVKSDYENKFTNGTASGTLNVMVTERTTGLYFDFYLDKECTTKVDDVYATSLDGSTTVVEDFPNGRVLYLKLNADGITQNVKEIWFSTGKNTTPVAVSRYVRDGEARTIYKDDPSKSQYLYKMDGGALPIYIDGVLSGNDYVFVNVQCYKDVAGSMEQAGSVIPVKFNIVNHTRPAVVTYDPSESGVQRSTAQSVDAIGTPSSSNEVYAKFSSTGTNYTIEGLLNEPHVIYDIERTGVFSTEVAGRKISGVQIKNASDGNYVSTMSTNNYWYLFATTLKLSQYEYVVDLDDTPTPTSIDEPSVTATYYDKVKKANVDASSGDNITVSYSVANYNGAAVSVNATTGEITLGSNSGYAIVTVNYHNANNITVNKRTSTMEDASETYVIYLTKSSEHLPKIEPSSRKFYPNITVKVTADKDWDAWYVVKDVNETAPTDADIVSTGTKVDKNTFKTFPLNDTKKVYAVAYDGSSVYSAVISETYTLGEQVLPPYFVPDGITSPYYYYTETLGVEARTRTTGSTVYYTISHGGSSPEDPVIGASGTQRYDGLQGITLTEGGTYKIKAIAFKDGIQSDVVEATYIYSSISAPYFDVNGTGNYTSGEHAVTTSDLITIGSNVVPSTGTMLKHYYTLDDTDPAEDGGTLYTGGFTLVKTVTAKAYSVLVDASGNEVQQSAVTTVTFTIATPLDVWEAVEETTPDGEMKETDGRIISKDPVIIGLYANPDNNTGTKINRNSLSKADGGTATKTYAQGDITVTFGGPVDKKEGWKSMTIADPAVGSPIDGVGTYSIAGPDNSKMEAKNNSLTEPSDNYNHMYSVLPTTHEKTFHLPTKGAYVKFEPEKDGEVTIWGLQHGSLNYNDGITLCDKFIRYRPVYFVDEQGKSYTAKSAVSSARLSEEWSKIEATAASNSWTGWKENQTIIHQGSSLDVQNKGLNVTESQAIYNLYKKYITDNNIKIGDPIAPFAVHNGNTISTNNGNYTDNSNDKTGYVMLTGGYVKYTFEVKAGKTYYFFGQGTKIGIRGFQFVPTETASRTSVTIDPTQMTLAGKTPFSFKSDYANQPMSVTLSRSFYKDKWAPLVLPFSVSGTQLEKIFGAGTAVIHFNNILDGNIIQFMMHTNQMIVAGTPVIIKPTKENSELVNVTFDGVQIEADAVETLTGSKDDYSMIGSLIQTANTGDVCLHPYDYYIGTDGKIYRYTGTSNYSVGGTRNWLRPKSPDPSRVMSVGFSSVEDEDEDDSTTTGIMEVVNATDGSKVWYTNGAVYDLKGQKVSDSSTKDLPKGVYIVNGKKVVVE